MALTEAELKVLVTATYQRASTDWSLSWTDYGLMGVFSNSDTWVQLIGKLQSMRNAFRHLLDCVEHLHGYKFGEDPEGFMGLMMSVNYWWTGPAEELTWETIVTAWANASKTGRLYTVLTIDEMRKTVWNEEFTSFTLQAPGEE